MDFVTNVTQKGQVTIPRDIRDLVGIELRSKVRVEAGNGFVKIISADTMLDQVDEFEAEDEVIPDSGQGAAKALKEQEREMDGKQGNAEAPASAEAMAGKQNNTEAQKEDQEDKGEASGEKVKTWFGITYRKS